MGGSEQVEGSLAGKFNAPPVGGERYLLRTGLAERIGAEMLKEKRALLVQAQAGQGKSIFTAQLLDRLQSPFAWYQLGPEDGDPVLLLGSLLTCLSRALPGFRSPVLAEMLASGVMSAHEAPGGVDLLANDLAGHLRKDFYLVFDDVWLVESSPLSRALLNRLVQAAPPALRPVMISRHPIPPLLELSLPPEHLLVIGNDDLALAPSDVAGLFNEVLGLPVTVDAVQALHAATEGWIMGLMMAANIPMAHGGGNANACFEAFGQRGREDLLDYFTAQVLSRLPKGLRRTMAKLSLLQQIPLSLAAELAEVEGVEAVLQDLEQRNFFVRVIDRERGVFSFHHLFRDCLRSLLDREYPPAEIGRFKSRIARWYLEHGEAEEALRFYLDGQQYEAAQKLLCRVGMQLKAQNRIVTLAAALRDVPEQILEGHPWLAYYYGVGLVNTDPSKALPVFAAALSEFRRRDNRRGELMALTQILHYHAAVDGRHNRGREIQPRAAALFDQLSEELEPAQRINVANILVLTYSLYNTELDKADRYLSLGLQVAQEQGLENLEAEARMVRSYRHLFAGDFGACRREIEHSLRLLDSPRVSAINKGALQLAHLNLLEFEGDFPAYEHHKLLFRERLGAEVVDGSVFGAFIRLWDIDMELALGRLDDCRKKVRWALEGNLAGSGPHLRSQYLKYHAYLLALEGRGEEALAVVEESLSLRAEVGGRYFEAITHTLAGATCARLGLPHKALEHFDLSLKRCTAMHEYFHRGAVHAHRADLYLDLGDTAAAHEDIRAMLRSLRRGGYRHFYVSSPWLLKKLLAEAVRCGIETAQAREIAAERFGLGILADGSLIPLLEVHALGRVELACGGEKVLLGGQLSGAQRQLLALLLAAPGQSVEQEEVQSALWPESSPSKSRSSFDNLVSRLRRSLAEVFGQREVKHYVVLQKGVLALVNCRCDFERFAAHARQGLLHARQQELWQADNAFRVAFETWQGEFLAGSYGHDTVELRRQSLNMLHLESAEAWCAILEGQGQASRAIAVAEGVLLVEPTHEPLVRQLYNLHARSGDGVKARRTLERYAKALKGAGFSPVEVEGIVDAFWSRA